MVWFKADDKLHGHEKTAEAARNELGRAAMGLWVVAGTWCGDHETDGRVSLRVVQRLGWGKRHAERLVALGFWERDGADAYRFHDWEHYQPTAEEKRSKNEKKREAGRLGGLASGRSRREANASKQPQAPADLALNPRPDPTRPDPVDYVDSVGDDATTAPDDPPPALPGALQGPPSGLDVAKHWNELATLRGSVGHAYRHHREDFNTLATASRRMPPGPPPEPWRVFLAWYWRPGGWAATHAHVVKPRSLCKSWDASVAEWLDPGVFKRDAGKQSAGDRDAARRRRALDAEQAKHDAAYRRDMQAEALEGDEGET